MYSKFHSIDNRPSNCFSYPLKFPASNNNLSYFAHESIRAGTGAESSRREFFRNPNPNAMRESVQRELEKERIRAEIIAEEVYRRRILEEEVRREMMFEREMAFGRGEREMAFGRGEREIGFGSSSLSMHYKTRAPFLTNMEHRTGVSPYRNSGSGTLPFQRDPVVAENGVGYSNAFSSGVKKEIEELKGFVPEVNKDKATVLTKPIAIDLKRKASKPPIGATVDPSTGSKKPKIQEEWSCALCHVTATSERALNDHLRGKKHKARESGLNSQRTGFGTGLLLKTGSTSTAKPIKVPGACATNQKSSRKQNDKAGAEASLGKVGNKRAQEQPRTDKKISIMKGKEASLKKKNEEADIPKKTSASVNSKNTPKFLCEICQVGTYSLKVMNVHKKGKPHLAKVKKLKERDEAASASGEMPVLKVIVENKEPNNAASVEKGVIEENEKHYVDVAKESSNKGTPAQRGVFKVKKEDKEPHMAASVDKDVVEEKKEMCIGAASEVKTEIEGELKSSSKEGADFNVTGVEVLNVNWS